jgi:hypothetical protein
MYLCISEVDPDSKKPLLPPQQKPPKKPPLYQTLKYQGTRLHDIFIIPSFSIYIRIRKKNRYTLKNRKNRVNRVSALIINHLRTKNRVPIAYQSRTRPKMTYPIYMSY